MFTLIIIEIKIVYNSFDLQQLFVCGLNGIEWNRVSVFYYYFYLLIIVRLF
jgi:hypothetical protein